MKKFKKRKGWQYKGNYARKRLQAAAVNLGLDKMPYRKSADIATAIGRELKYDFEGVSKNSVVSFVLVRLETEKPALLNGMVTRKTDTPKPKENVKSSFYKSWEWRTIRMQMLKEHGAICQCCGATRNDTAMSGEPVRICVDHIKPLATHWHLRLDKSNLQVLCDECNQGKGAWDDTDWRTDSLIEAQLRYTI